MKYISKGDWCLFEYNNSKYCAIVIDCNERNLILKNGKYNYKRGRRFIQKKLNIKEINNLIITEDII